MGDNMEEQKVKTEKRSDEKRIPTYEDLKNYCNQLMMQRNQLAEKLEQVTSVLTRIPWLFKVLENASKFSDETVKKSAEQIEFILFGSENAEKNSKGE